MATGNRTEISEFIPMSFSSLLTEIQSLLFLTFLTIYLVTLMGKSLIILVTLADPMLHSPMYSFLRNLSFLDIGFNLVIVAKMLGTHCLPRTQHISLPLRCATQMYFFSSFGVIMNKGHRPTGLLPFLAFPGYSCSYCARHQCWLFSFPFLWHNNGEPQFLVTAFEIYAIIGNILVVIAPLIPLAKGKHKPSSTLIRHILLVRLSFLSIIKTSPELFRLSLTLLCTFMLNPIIYSLRNNEVKKMTFIRMVCKTLALQK
uniref:Uncharacterized protein n=1 Tax=Rhinopithecus bieti TaxID=61621 RepID=A0A2K6KD70_RHIBE